jgi:hypothetical protein
MTYRELLEQLQSLTEDQLLQTVATLGFERSGSDIAGVWVAQEDYISPDEGIETASSYADDAEYQDEPVVVAKGRVLLEEQSN